AQIHTSIGQIINPSVQAWLASQISLLGPVILIAGGIFWIVFPHVWPALRRGLRPGALAIVYEPQVHTSTRRGNMRDYHVEVRNRTTDRTIADVIVTWDETPFTRFMDKKHSRDCLLSPTSIAPSSSVSVFLFSVEDDLQTARNKKDVLGLASTFTVQATGKG